MTNRISILGSTGSIGTQALDVVEKLGIKVTALAANSNVDLLEYQAKKYSPKMVAMMDDKAAVQLSRRLSGTRIAVLAGMNGVCQCARAEAADTVLNSIVGMAGIEPTLTAIRAKKIVALANKETLVAGGRLITETAKQHKVKILPVDSEHSAIFQCLQGMNKKRELKSLILTASGGPFFGYGAKQLENVTAADALKHPNWSMGAKITIDCATMMNKGLELIEAVWLFDVSPKDVQIVVHRESIIHSLIEYTDNAVIAQLGVPDMRIPIQYALTYPERYPSPVKRLSLTDIGKLTFFEPDYKAFPCLDLCRQAINKGGLYPAIANGANEEANRLFREGKISFNDIPKRIQSALESVPSRDDYNLNDILHADKLARRIAAEL